MKRGAPPNPPSSEKRARTLVQPDDDEPQRKEKRVSSGRTQLDEEDDEQDEIERQAKPISDVDGEVDDEEDLASEYRIEEGIRIEPFNLRRERRQGYYDAAGTYIWKSQRATGDGGRVGEDDPSDDDGDEAPTAETDPWQDDYLAWEKAQGKTVALKADEKEDSPAEIVDVRLLRQALVKYVQVGETPIMALRRLRGKPGFDQVTEAADGLLSAGDANVYSTPVDDGAEWVYKWAMADSSVHGPFPSVSVNGWIKQGFFQGRDAVVKRVGEKEWRPLSAIFDHI